MTKFFLAVTIVCLGTILLSGDAQWPPSSSGSPDKRWEYKCIAYYDSECSPEIVKAGTTEVVVNLSQDLAVSGSESGDAQIFWAPDSKRFAFNYSPLHPHHTQSETLAFYQLHVDKWVQLPSLIEETEHTQLFELAKKHLLKGFNPGNCEPGRDMVRLQSWIDNNTAILYAPCYDRISGELKTALLFTVKFDAAGKARIVKTHQMSKKEVGEEQ